MNRILSFFDGIGHNIVEYGLIGAGIVIGILVTALKVQGSRLHKAQVDLLDQVTGAKMARAAQDTEKARQAYLNALLGYMKAGGKILLFVGLLGISTPARSESKECYGTLSACSVLVHTQDAQIQVLQESIKAWKKQAEAPPEKAPILLISVAAGALGGSATAEVSGVQRGLLIGGAVGALSGLVIGLVFR